MIVNEFIINIIPFIASATLLYNSYRTRLFHRIRIHTILIYNVPKINAMGRHKTATIFKDIKMECMKAITEALSVRELRSNIGIEKELCIGRDLLFPCLITPAHLCSKYINVTAINERVSVHTCNLLFLFICRIHLHGNIWLAYSVFILYNDNT